MVYLKRNKNILIHMKRNAEYRLNNMLISYQYSHSNIDSVAWTEYSFGKISND